MAEGSGKAREIFLGDDFDVVVKVNGIRIDVHTDGSVDAYTQGAVKVHSPANDTGDKAIAMPAEPKIGDKQIDGSIYAGISPDTGKPMYTTRADAPLTYSFNQAQKCATTLHAYGNLDWRVPTKGELNVLFQNRAAIGGVDESGSDPDGWYWSSSHFGNTDFVWDQRFSDGFQNYGSKGIVSSLRCVR